MANFQITAPNGKKYMVNGDNAEGALAALKKMLSQSAPDASADVPQAVAPSALPENAALATAGPGPTGRIDPALYDMGAIGRRFVPGDASPVPSPPETVTAADGTQMVFDPATGSYTSRELMAGNMAPSRGQAALAGAASGFTLGLGDEIAGAIGGPLLRERGRAMTDAARRDYPVTTGAAELAGGLAAPVPVGGPVNTLGQAAVTGAKVGATAGFIYGAASADGPAVERLKEGLTGAAAGALIGAATPVAVTYGAKAWRGVFGASAAKPTLESLRAAKSAAYKAVDDAGEVFDGAAMAGLRDRVAAELSGGNYVSGVDRQTDAVVALLDRKAGTEMTLGQLDKLRQEFYKRLSAAPNEVGILDAIDEIDTMIAGRAATNDLMLAARVSNARYKKAELLELAFQKAEDQTASTGSGGNILNKYRQAVTSIINNPKNARWFSSEEIDTMRKFVESSGGQNALRLFGKLSPNGNGLMLALNLAGAGSTGGASLAITGAAVGAKAIADASARKGADRLIEMAGRGGTMPLPAAVSPPVAGAAANVITSPYQILFQRYGGQR